MNVSYDLVRGIPGSSFQTTQQLEMLSFLLNKCQSLWLQALWTKNGSCIVYPCHAIIVSIDVTSGHQQFFMGHTDKVF